MVSLVLTFARRVCIDNKGAKKQCESGTDTVASAPYLRCKSYCESKIYEGLLWLDLVPGEQNGADMGDQVTNWWGRLNNNALSNYYKARQVWVFGAAKHERALSSSESDPPPVGYKKKKFRQLGSGVERT